MAQGIGAVRQPKRGKIRVDLSAFEHFRAQFLLADHRVSQERFLLSYSSLRSRQLFAQCANFGLKLSDVAERPTQSLLMRQLEERDVVVWFLKALLERLRLDNGLIDKLNRCAHCSLISFLTLFILFFVRLLIRSLSSLD